MASDVVRTSAVSKLFVGAPTFFTHIEIDLADRHVLPTATKSNARALISMSMPGRFETSAMWAVYPDLVHKDIVPTLKWTDSALRT